MANKPLQNYGTRILVDMSLTTTHRFSTEDIYLVFFLMTEDNNYLITENGNRLIMDKEV